MTMIPWLGEVSHPTIAAKRAYEITLGKMLQPRPSAPTDMEVPYLKSASIQWDGVIADPEVRMWASESEIRDLAVNPGDLLICEGGDAGRAAIYSGPQGYMFQNSVHRARPRTDSDIRYFLYLLKALHGSEYLDVLCNKATIRHLTGEKLGALDIPLPPEREQRRIADFLDAETMHIDRLASLRRRQLELSAEALAARAAEATGRTASPQNSRSSQKTKIPLRRAVRSVRTGSTPDGLQEYTPSNSRELRPWYTPAALSGPLSIKRADKAISLDQVDDAPAFQAGSVLIAGIGESLGKIAYLDHAATGNQQLTAIQPDGNADGRFLAWQLWAAQEEVREWAQYSRIRIINNDTLKSFPIYLPNLSDQIRTREELDERQQDFERLSLDPPTRFVMVAAG